MGLATLLERVNIKIRKVFPKYYFYFIFLVLVCCVVEENVCKGSIKPQCLTRFGFYSPQEPNHAQIYQKVLAIEHLRWQYKVKKK